MNYGKRTHRQPNQRIDLFFLRTDLLRVGFFEKVLTSDVLILLSQLNWSDILAAAGMQMDVSISDERAQRVCSTATVQTRCVAVTSYVRLFAAMLLTLLPQRGLKLQQYTRCVRSSRWISSSLTLTSICIPMDTSCWCFSKLSKAFLHFCLRILLRFNWQTHLKNPFLPSVAEFHTLLLIVINDIFCRLF